MSLLVPDQDAIDYATYSRGAGRLVEPSTIRGHSGRHRVRFRSATSHYFLPESSPSRQQFRVYRRFFSAVVTLLLSVVPLAIEVGFMFWLVRPNHFPQATAGLIATSLSFLMVAILVTLQSFRIVNVATLCFATFLARNPIPVMPEPGLSVAFLTTIVPSKEPLEMALTTLKAARNIGYDGTFDVWLLDEGDDPEVKRMCEAIGVNHFSRKGVEEWNQPTGRFKRKTKHGNINAWLYHVGHRYDVMLGVDTDHVPLANYAERMLGYFRDPDVGFVVGPQVYGNTGNLISRLAESQQFLFHSVLQRAANATASAMLVGTNYAIRVSALLAIGGLQDSITEDAATSIVWHASKNKETRRHWKSVYTPDVLAVGEGPSSWTDYFSQQLRWSRGTMEVIMSTIWRVGWRLPPTRLAYYALLMSYYPTAALAWILGAVSSATYLVGGFGGFEVPAALFVMFYVDAAVLQLMLYAWNRKYNVSPHEQQGSFGLGGMFVSIVSAPLYVVALINSLLRRDDGFVITAKGDALSPDRWSTFRLNIAWGMFLLVLFVASFPLGNNHPAMRAWTLLSVMTCFAPVVIWLFQRTRRVDITASAIAHYSA